MKTQNNQFLVALNREEMKTLTETVKEVVDRKMAKVFSAAELWNIQRNMRTARSRRLFA